MPASLLAKLKEEHRPNFTLGSGVFSVAAGGWEKGRGATG